MAEERSSWRDASRSGILSIKGTQRGYGMEDVSEITSPAKYVNKDGKRYLFYKEYAEDGSHQQVRLTVEGNDVILKKSGMGNSLLHFRKGTMMPCHYQSPVGAMELVSRTKKIRLKEGEHSLTLEMEYALYMHDQHMSDYVLEIHWKENK